MGQKRYRKIKRRKIRMVKKLLLITGIAGMATGIFVMTFKDCRGNRDDEYSQTLERDTGKNHQEYQGGADETETTEVPVVITSGFSEEYKDKINILKEYVVCLDAGHGGTDVGAERSTGEYEKNETLKLTRLVKAYLEEAGVQVVMTREKDKDVSLAGRKEIAEKCKADLLLSIHRNIYEGWEEVNGMEAWINNLRPADATEASNSILQCIEQEVPGVNNRGIKWGTMDNVNENYAVNKVSMTSLILEVGFASSEYDNRLFDEYLEEYARGIARGILEYCSQNR